MWTKKKSHVVDTVGTEETTACEIVVVVVVAVEKVASEFAVAVGDNEAPQSVEVVGSSSSSCFLGRHSWKGGCKERLPSECLLDSSGGHSFPSKRTSEELIDSGGKPREMVGTTSVRYCTLECTSVLTKGQPTSC